MSENPSCIRAIPYENKDAQSLTMCLYMDPKIPEEIDISAKKMFKNYEIVDLLRRPLSNIVTRLPPSQKQETDKLALLSRTIDKNLHLFENRMNVTAVQASYKVTDSIEQNIPCVTVFVLGKGKIPAGETDIRNIKEKNRVFEQTEFDVVEGYYKLTTGSSLAGYASPLEGGVGIGVEGVDGAGTLGGFLEDEKGNVYILSNEHVLHPHDAGDKRVIVQPSQTDYEIMKKEAEECFNEYHKKAQNIPGLENLVLQPKEKEKISKKHRPHIVEQIQKQVNDAKKRLDDIKSKKFRPVGKYVYGLKDNFKLKNGHEVYVDAAIATLNEAELSDIKYHKIELEDKTNRCPLYGFETNKYWKTKDYKPPNGEIIEFERLNELLRKEDSELRFMKIGRSTGFTEEGTIEVPVNINKIRPGPISRLNDAQYVYCEDCIKLVTIEINPIPKTKKCDDERCVVCNKELVNHGEVKSTWARNCFVVGRSKKPFSEKGDSGSLVFDSKGRAWGLLFGDFEHSNFTFSLISPLCVVLHALGKEAGKLKLW